MVRKIINIIFLDFSDPNSEKHLRPGWRKPSPCLSYRSRKFVAAKTKKLLETFLASNDLIDLDGEVVDVQRERFVVLTTTGLTVTAYLSGRQKINKIRVIQGDRVRVQVSPYDLSKGRIVYRYWLEVEWAMFFDGVQAMNQTKRGMKRTKKKTMTPATIWIDTKIINPLKPDFQP